MALPPRLERELAELRSVHAIDVCEDGGWINLIFHAFPIGEGFKLASSDLLIRVQRSYPDSGPDMFWLETGVLLADGRAPQAATSIETYQGRSWRRFSWHHKTWNPAIDNLYGYLEFVRQRLREKK